MSDESYHDLNIHELEKEWVVQVGMFREHADALADANLELNNAETELEVRKAELKEASARLDLAVRRNCEDYGLDKVTEGAVEKAVILQPDYLRAKEAVFAAMRKVNNAKHYRDIRKVAVDTVGQQRKPALQDLVQLWLASYFASPKLPRDEGGRKMEEARDRSYGGRPPKATVKNG